MKLIELGESDRGRYNQFVMSQPQGSFLQSWEWGEWRRQEGEAPYRFFLTGDSNNPDMAGQFLRMPLPGGGFYLYAPYGPVAGSRFEVQGLRFLLQELKRKFPQAVFIRIEPAEKIPGLPALARKSVNIQPAITMIVDIGKTDGELLAAMHHKTRYNIKIAERHGVEVQKEMVAVPQHGIYVGEAVDLIVQTQERQKYRGHPARYYHKLINFLALRQEPDGLRMVIYKALLQKKILASGIMMDFGGTRTYLYGGSSDEHRNAMAPYLLHWTAMREARDAGMERYDLGGSEVASGGEKGFTRFKQGFGGRVAEFSGAYDFVCRPLWYNLYRIFRSANRIIKHINR